ncbi:hypothetical protein LRN42_000092 [Shigella sonnei]|nr:hypothetical protein [Shigella sonnei]
MELVKQPVNAWTLQPDEAVRYGFFKKHAPKLIDGTLGPEQDLMYVVLFDDYRAMAIYGESGKAHVVHIERYVFNELDVKEQFDAIMTNTKPVPEHIKLQFLTMLNPDEHTVRLIRNDPATQELTDVLLDLKLHVALERAEGGKINTCIRRFCKAREATAKHHQTRNILKAIRSVALPEIKMKEVLSLYDAYMNDEVECVVKS